MTKVLSVWGRSWKYENDTGNVHWVAWVLQLNSVLSSCQIYIVVMQVETKKQNTEKNRRHPYYPLDAHTRLMIDYKRIQIDYQWNLERIKGSALWIKNSPGDVKRVTSIQVSGSHMVWPRITSDDAYITILRQQYYVKYSIVIPQTRYLFSFTQI